MLKPIRLVRDRIPRIGDESDWLVINIFSLPILADGGETAQEVTGRADKAWAMVHANLGLHMAQLMREAVGGVYVQNKTLLKVSREL